MKKKTQVYAVVATVGDAQGEMPMNFDEGGETAVCDNAATAHICNNKHMYVGEIRPVKTQGVATIGGTNFKPSGIGTVQWSWRDDNYKKHTEELDNVLFFPESPVNIISLHQLGRHFGNDEEGTWIQTKLSYLIFTWNQGKYTRKLLHLPSALPVIGINEGTSWTKAFLSFIRGHSLKEKIIQSRHAYFSDDQKKWNPIKGDKVKYVKCGHIAKAIIAKHLKMREIQT